MNKESFVTIIDGIREQYEKDAAMSEAIQKAITDAGRGMEDFCTKDSFEVTANVLIDKIIQGVALDMANELNSKDKIEDRINYYLYELEIFDRHIQEADENGCPIWVDPYWVDQTGSRHPLANAGDLYDAIISDGIL